MQKIEFDKKTGLVPAIIQDSKTGMVLMLGYMNQEAIDKTMKSGKVTFYSRSKKRLWTKGESSGNYLDFIDLKVDCDGDSLLIQASPQGPVCHKGSDTCWNQKNTDHILDFLLNLEKIIESRQNKPLQGSYTSKLFARGLNKIAQKFGEESFELVIESKDQNLRLFRNEAADVMYHLLVLLKAKKTNLKDVVEVLKERHKI